MKRAVAGSLRHVLAGVVCAYALISACTVPAGARPPRDDLFDPSVLDFASCDVTTHGTDAVDVLTYVDGRSVSGLGGDDVLTGSFCLWGGDGNDRLTSTVEGSGWDWLQGGPGNDRLIGNDHENSLKAGPGDDTLIGNAGDDRLDAGAGNDDIDAGPGNDTITGGAGHNVIRAGPGNDLISANDGSRELVDCGPGDDLVHADHADRLVGCEHVEYPGNPYARLFPHVGSFKTTFALRYVAPYTTELGYNDLGIAAYDYDFIQTPSPRCHPDLDIVSASPMDVKLGSRVRDRFHLRPGGTGCRGLYKVAIDYSNSTLPTECDSIAGSHPHYGSDYSDCDFTDTIDYFTFRIR
jgi:RTX calcium-binding nonapeptide repeat (4 copies)